MEFEAGGGGFGVFGGGGIGIPLGPIGPCVALEKPCAATGWHRLEGRSPLERTSLMKASTSFPAVVDDRPPNCGTNSKLPWNSARVSNDSKATGFDTFSSKCINTAAPFVRGAVLAGCQVFSNTLRRELTKKSAHNGALRCIPYLLPTPNSLST